MLFFLYQHICFLSLTHCLKLESGEKMHSPPSRCLSNINYLSHWVKAVQKIVRVMAILAGIAFCTAIEFWKEKGSGKGSENLTQVI